MAEYKTAEQYVVERLETLEREVEEKEASFKTSLGLLEKNLATAHKDLKDVCEILDMLRDYVHSHYDVYLGTVISFDNFNMGENPALVSRLTEYFDLRTGDERE